MIIDKNKIPKHWQVKKLGEILKVSSGKGLKVNSLEGGKYPVYGVMELMVIIQNICLLSPN